MKQTEIINQLSDAELKKQLFLSQGIFVFVSIILSLFFSKVFLIGYFTLTGIFMKF